MIAIDEDALICDLAETYQIYDYKRLPVQTVAVFSLGLRDNSRIKMKLSGSKISLEQSLLASIADRLGILIWQKTKDGVKGNNVPKSILATLNGEAGEKEQSEMRVFESGEEFLKARAKLLGKEEAKWQQN
jgi:hypothetical protein